MPSLLHVLNGDATREKLERADVPGDIIVWADVLHDGPVPGGFSAEEFRRVRARHLASYPDLGISEEEALRRLQERDAGLERYPAYDEVVFWFEHDLYDQLILIRHLHWLAHQTRGARTRFSLICIGEYPGVPHFSGLGPLQPSQLASLVDTRTLISEGEIALGQRAWDVFTGADPLALDGFRRGDTRALPFLEGALRRHLEDFPGTNDGLSRSERQVLRAIGGEAHTAGAIFRATQGMEERILMGDLTFWGVLRRLAGAPHALVELSPSGNNAPMVDRGVRITDTGRDVLAGRADHVVLNGIDRWMGGVHLTDGRYRWDGTRLLHGG